MVIESVVALTLSLASVNGQSLQDKETPLVSVERAKDETLTTTTERDQRRSRVNMRRAKGAVQHQANLQVAMSSPPKTQHEKASECTTPGSASAMTASALSNDDVELMDVLVKYGNNPEGLPALHYAILQGDERAVELLLAHGASPFTKDIQGHTCLYVAVQSGNLKLVDLFLDLGANINDSGDNYCSPLSLAIEKKQNEIAKHLVGRGAAFDGGDDILYSNDRAANAVYVCCSHGNFEMLTFLLENGAQVLDRTSGISLLDALLSRGYSKDSFGVSEKMRCLEYLVEKRLISLPLDPGQYQGDIPNMTPEAVEYLLDNMYLFPNQVSNGTPLLYYAMSRLDLLEVLLKHGVDLNAKASAGSPIFQHVATHCSSPCLSDPAIDKERRDILSFFIRNGVDVNIANDRGWTVLHKLAWYNTDSLSDENRIYLKNVWSMLIEAGLDINARDNGGKTALAYVKDEPLKKWLIALGATE